MSLIINENFFETVLAEMPGEIAVFDSNRRYIYINPHAIKDTKVREWIIGKTDYEYCKYRKINIEIAEQRNIIFDQVIAEGKVVEWEEFRIDRDGNEHYHLRRMGPIFNDKGEINFLIGYGMEITEQKKMGKLLEENRVFLDQVLNSNPHLIFVKDIEGIFRMANKATADLFDVTPDNVLGRSNVELHPNKTEVAIFNSNDQRVVNEMKAIRIEEVFTKKDGSVIYFDTIKLPLKKENGEVQILGLLTDITDRKLAEEKVKKSEIRMIEAQELALIGNWEINLADYSIQWSPAMFSIWEMDPLKGPPKYKELNEVVHPEDARRVLDTVLPMNKPGSQTDITYRIITPSGIKHVRTIAKPIINDEGKAVRLIGTVMDITKEKKTDALLRFNEMRLNEAQEMAHAGSWEYDLIEQKNYLSPAAYKLLECDPSLPAPSFEEFLNALYASEKEKLRSILTKLAREGGTTEAEYRVITFKGNHRIFHSKAVAEIGSNGVPVKLYGTMLDITEQKRTEEILLKNEQRLLETQELARVGSWQLDLETMETEWSGGTFAIFGISPTHSALMSTDFEKAIYPDDLEAVNNGIQNSIETGHPFELEYRIVLSDGQIKNVQSRAKALKNQDGKVIRLVGSIIDITEQKKTEEILLQKEQRLNEAQEMAKIGSWEIYPDFSLVWSHGFYLIWERDPALGPPSYDEYFNALHPDDRGRVLESGDLLFKGKVPKEMTYRIVTPSGKVKVLSSQTQELLDSTGKIIRYIGTISDITEQKKTEEILLQNEQRLIEAQEMAKMGSWELFPDHTVRWSSGCYSIWERDPTLGPMPFDEFFSSLHPDDHHKIQTRTGKVSQDAFDFESDFRIITPSGKEKYLLSIVHVLRDDAGNVAKYIGTLTDITQQKKIEQELIAAKQEADESIRSKEYFFANVGHELRTPLNGILGMSRLLNKTELNSTQRNYIEILNNTASNLLMIINDILDISKIESGTLVMESISFNPAQIADTAVQTQMYKAEEKDLSLRHLNEGELLPLIEGDPYRLNQILLNLLNNAIKFTEQGEVILNHKISAETEDAVTIEFSVSDTGIGIPDGALESIFESFTQVHRGPQNKYGGTGLGLSISKNLVELQGGKIWVTSTLGKGSDFRFSIPYKKVSSKQLKKKVERIDPDVLGPLRILLAEDNRVNQYITEAILQDWGFKVDIASNGYEAVDFVKRNDYDLILMDIQMPELGGIEATKMIREMQDSTKAKLPIIAITANTTRQAHKKFLLEGLNDWLVKPFKEDTLFRKISLHIKGKERFATTIHQPRFPVRKKPVVAKENLYDLSLLRRDARDNPQFMLKMLGIFIESIPPIIEKMQDHFVNGEMDAISNLAHKIKPTLDGAGIYSLRETIRNIENYRDKKRSREQLKNDIANLEQVIAVVVVSFRKEMEVLTD